MNRSPDPWVLPPAQVAAAKVFSAFERFLHIEALSGIALIAATTLALAWANSPFADSYHHVWETPLAITFGSRAAGQSLHFLINEGLMTIFFLVVGMEIRREIHEGALSSARAAALPLAAAVGGVIAPAAIYFWLNPQPPSSSGWAVPTATDIAFAVGVLALLGKSLPATIRIFLLALAIIDDIAAVLIIAVFYSAGVDFTGFAIAAVAIVSVIALQRVGIASVIAYAVPGAILWYGLLRAGVHPTLAGVVLGLLTPVVPLRWRERPVEDAERALGNLAEAAGTSAPRVSDLIRPLRTLRETQRELVAPVVSVQAALHPWVAYGVMPLFALANAGVVIDAAVLADHRASNVMIGVAVALVLGKPLGIFAGSWAAVRLNWCVLPPGVTWGGIAIVGCLGGIGFTMSIFIASLAFTDTAFLSAAKLGVLAASVVAGVVGIAGGLMLARRIRPGVAISRTDKGSTLSQETG